MVVWTSEMLAGKSTTEIETLLENATRLGRNDVAAMCCEELARRKAKTVKVSSRQVNKGARYVSEFHFVCPRRLGVLENQDGTILTGTWVVAEEHAEKAARYGSLVALHESKGQLSYVQGKVISWQKSPRQRQYSDEHLTQIAEGIDFMIEPTDTPVQWQGEGAGEKGYVWADRPNGRQSHEPFDGMKWKCLTPFRDSR